MKCWQTIRHHNNQVQGLAASLEISPNLAQLLLNRGLHSVERAKRFLKDTFVDLSSPFEMINMGRAVEMVEEAIQAGASIVIYGDYDVDGICASVLLKEALDDMGACASIYIPSRMEEGYGLNDRAIQNLVADGAGLVITVDNGIAAQDILEPFINDGLQVLVTDHHSLPDVLPNCTIINPKLDPDDSAPFYHICGAGVAFKLVMALRMSRGWAVSEEAMARSLELCALATIADIVPLYEDNRLLVKAGLQVMNRNPRPGIAALLDVAHLSFDGLDAQTVAFQLAPRINAAGRLDQVPLALSLLLCQDELEASQLAERLDALNGTRKEMENKAMEEAVAQIESNPPASAIVVWAANWHAGVIGIVASRLVEKYGLPALVLTRPDADKNIYSGSGRAPEGISLFETVGQLSHLLLKFGGHARACGLTLTGDLLEEFRQAFVALCDASKADWYGKETLLVDQVLKPQEVTMSLYDEVLALEPTGCGNPKATFALEAQRDIDFRSCGKDGAHLQLNLPRAEAPSLRAIAFRRGNYATDHPWPNHDLLFHLDCQTFRGETRLELIVDDLRPSYMGNEPLDDALFLRGELLLEDDPYRYIEEKYVLHTKAVGVSYEGRQELIAALSPEAVISLVREPQNENDANAVSVCKDDQVLGYLKRGLALHLAPLMDQGIVYRVQGFEKTGGQDGAHWGLNLIIQKVVDDEAGVAMASLPKRTALTAAEVAASWLSGGRLHSVQADALNALHEGRNVLAVMGTGRGKSLIYQAMAAEIVTAKEQMAVVFFPLRALLNDQYQSIVRRYEALHLTVVKACGDMTGGERADFFFRLEKGLIDMVLTTPEFFLAHEKAFRNGAKEMGFFVVDEAHHLAGRRHGYQQLAQRMTHYPRALKLALTATMPKDEVSVIKPLAIQAVFCDNNSRDNLRVIDVRSTAQKNHYLYELLKRREKTIVYVNSRQQAFTIAAKLRSSLPLTWRHSVGYYHGGLSRLQRQCIEADFSDGHLRTLIATSAFGEGMHLPNVRHVVLYHLCFSREAYNQLAGRAGRDGQEAFVHLLYGHRDVDLNELILDGSCPDRHFLGAFYKFLVAHHMNDDGFAPNLEIWQHDKNLSPRGKLTKEPFLLGLRIFKELGFLNEEEGQYVLVRHPEKRDLKESVTFLEGHAERSDFEQFQHLAFSKDVVSLQNAIRRPLCPEQHINFGGEAYGK